ncbi:MAG: hypothetical protein LUD27_01485 [Clostridia bacterium]|nr:hypothetical protein [Clostridia bacterium]
MKKYSVYQLKKALLPFAVMAFAGLVLYFIPLTVMPDGYNFSTRVENLSYFLMAGAIAACMLMPIWSFRYKMNRRSADLYYSLPIKRLHLIIIHYLSGFAAIIAAYTAIFWLGFIVIAAKSASDGLNFSLINMLWLYLVSVVFIYAIYSLYSFAYTRANNVIDGIVFMIFATFAVTVIALLLSTVIWSKQLVEYIYPDGEITYRDSSVYYVSTEYYMPFMPLSVLTEHFTCLTLNESSWYFDFSNDTTYRAIDNVNIIISIAVYLLLSAACSAGLILLEKRNKSENCEQNSDSLFGYKVMIPLYEFTLCACIVYGSEILILLITIAAGYFVTAIWKRSLKIGWKAFIVLDVSVAVGILAGVLIACLH